MKYKVEFEHNIPVNAVLIKSPGKDLHITDFVVDNRKTIIRYLCVEAENESDAIRQAKRIVETIRF